MSRETAMNAIRSRFKTEVADVLSIPVLYDNAPGDPPDGEAEWIRFTILWGNASQTEFGGHTAHRDVALAVAQIFVPAGKGDGRSAEIADAIVPKFRAISIGEGVTFRTPYLTTVGRTGQYWQVNVSCPFFMRTVAPAQT